MGELPEEEAAALRYTDAQATLGDPRECNRLQGWERWGSQETIAGMNAGLQKNCSCPPASHLARIQGRVRHPVVPSIMRELFKQL